MPVIVPKPLPDILGKNINFRKVVKRAESPLRRSWSASRACLLFAEERALRTSGAVITSVDLRPAPTSYVREIVKTTFSY